MTETEMSIHYWNERRNDCLAKQIKLIDIEEDESDCSNQSAKSCDRDCFHCPYPDCYYCYTDTTEFEKECLKIGHPNEYPQSGGKRNGKSK